MSLFNSSNTIKYSANSTAISSDSWLKTDNRSVNYSYSPWALFSSVFILFMASFIGTGGNILILLAIAVWRKLRNTESVFLINLALADLFVTTIVEPISLIGKWTILTRNLDSMLQLNMQILTLVLSNNILHYTLPHFILLAYSISSCHAKYFFYYTPSHFII